MKKKTLKLVKILSIGIVILAVIYAVTVVVATNKLNKAYSALKEDGRPISLDEILPAPVKDFDNAALIYDLVFLKLRTKKITTDSQIEPSWTFNQTRELASKLVHGDINKDEKKKLITLLQSEPYVSAFKDLEIATAKPSCWYDLDYSNLILLALPHLSKLRALSSITSAAAMLAAEEGKVHIAYRHLKTSFIIADHVGDGTSAINELVSISIFENALTAMKYVLKKVTLTTEQDLEMIKVITQFDQMTSLTTALDFERFFGEHCFNEAKRSDPLFLLDQAAYLKIMHSYSQNSTKPYSKTVMDKLDRQIKELPPYYTISYLIMPSLGHIKIKYLKMIAKSRLSRIVLTLLQTKAETGILPQSLAELGEVGALKDPFTEKPFVYKLTNGGFTCYSLGPNTNDDSTQSKEKSDDISWTVD
jgi:hypothetical protein